VITPEITLDPETAGGSRSNETPGSAPLGTQRTLGLVVGGVGALGVAAGAITGVMAVARKGDVEARCRAGGGSYPSSCAPSASNDELESDAKSAMSLGTVSTVAFIAGGAALGAGLAIFLTAPRETRVALKMQPRHAALVCTW
jgi:hypothetical protein